MFSFFFCTPARTLGVKVLVRFLHSDCSAIILVVTFQLQVTVLVEECYGKNVGKCSGKAERQWSHRTTESETQQTNEKGNEQERGTQRQSLRFKGKRGNLLHEARVTGTTRPGFESLPHTLKADALQLHHPCGPRQKNYISI